MSLEYKTFQNSDDALKVCGSLLSVSRQSVRPFSIVWSELMSCIAKDNYVVQTENGSPVGFAAWIKLNRLLAQVYVNNLRWVTPLEHETGEVTFLHFFCSALGDETAMLEYLRKTFDNKHLAYAHGNVMYDIHKGSVANVLKLIQDE